MEDGEKLIAIKDAFVRKIYSVQTLAQMKLLVGDITPANVKAFIVAQLNQNATNYRTSATNSSTEAGNYDDLAAEIGNL